MTTEQIISRLKEMDEREAKQALLKIYRKVEKLDKIGYQQNEFVKDIREIYYEGIEARDMSD